MKFLINQIIFQVVFCQKYYNAFKLCSLAGHESIFFTLINRTGKSQVFCKQEVVLIFCKYVLEMFRFLKTKAFFKVWNFYFAQILTKIFEKQYVLTPFNLFFKFLHCLTLFPIFLVHVNWIVFYVTAHLFKFCYQQILAPNMSHSNKSWTWM